MRLTGLSVDGFGVWSGLRWDDLSDQLNVFYGPNEAGKTTLMKMLLGLHTPDEGRIRLFGSAPRTEQRRRIGYVPQNLGLYTALTASENLEFRAAVFDSEPAATAETREAMANRALDNLRAALLGERPRDLVNPHVWKG